MIAIRNILVGTDFSECSNKALMYGRQLARQFGAKLFVLHTTESLTGDLAGLDAFTAAVPYVQLDIEAAERRQLDALVTADDRRDLKAEPVFRTNGLPARAITDFARDAPIDLIVVGTHGRRGFAHAIMGSVAERIVRTAPCPVLTVREHEHEFAGRDLPFGSVKSGDFQ
jgi:nucleotide-binding universal stress UspA family protein